MSKRDALRALSKKFPAPKEVKSILKGLYDEPDRIIAIVGSAIAESFLERAIISRLPYQGQELIGQLFNNRGPMAEFHSKILIAQALGVITPNEASDFHRIKAIRNVFALASVNITFETDEIAKEVDDFVAYKETKAHMESSLEIKKIAEELALFSERKEEFIYMVQFCCMWVDFKQKEVTGHLMGEYGKHD